MKQHNSSTLSFEAVSVTRRSSLRRRLLAAGWIVFYVVLLDASLNLLFPYPRNLHEVRPGPLQQYLEFGRSVEGKLQRMTGKTNADSAPILPAGWMEREAYEELPKKAEGEHQMLVAAYGMSHTHLLADAMADQDERVVTRAVTAPGAPANWSYAAFEYDRERRKADVVILGVMTDGVAGISSTSGATLHFEHPYAYVYPRYQIEAERLRGEWPPFLDLKTYRETFFNLETRDSYKAWLAQHDNYYDPLLYNASIFDRSVFLRILRRAYAASCGRRRSGEVYDQDGFNLESEEVTILRKIVSEFARLAREDGSLPVVYIVNNQGRADHVYTALLPVLTEHNIAHLSSHVICPPSNPRLFLVRNSHFIPSKDRELALAMIKIIDERRRAPGR